MRIIHFSDPHCFANLNSWRGFFDKRGIGFFNTYLIRQHSFNYNYLNNLVDCIDLLKPDVVILTGDASTVGSPNEFKKASNFVDTIKSVFNGPLIAIPGNHDVYVNDSEALKEKDCFFAKTNTLWNCKDLSVRIANVTFYMIDVARVNDLWHSNAEISKEQINELESELNHPREDKELRISLCHFPIKDKHGNKIQKRRSLIGGEKLEQALQDGRLDIALCGHIHEPFLREESLKGGVEICAGSICKHAMINVIDYNEQLGIYRQYWINVSDMSVVNLVGTEKESLVGVNVANMKLAPMTSFVKSKLKDQ